MKNLSLRLRLLLLTVLPGILITAVMVTYYSVNGIKMLESELRAKGLSTVRHLAPISEYGIISGQLDSIYGLVQAVLQEPGIKAAIIVNQRGRTIAVSGRISVPADVIRQQLSGPQQVAETDHWIAFGAPVIRTQNDKDPLFDFIENDSNTRETIGHIFIELDKEELAKRQTELLYEGVLIAAIGLLLMAIFSILMADQLARPLQALANAVRRMSAGQLDSRVDSHSSGEMRLLEEGFNEMAERVQDAHHSLQTRIEEATAQLVFQARHDALTGLVNRREFEFRLEKALASLHAGGDPFCMLYLDLDRFKVVNDNCGHQAGDELLRQIALIFQGRLREQDCLGRLGGDEFGILLHNCTSPQAQQIAHELCALAAEYRFVWQGKIFSIGASIGLVEASREIRDVQEVISRCDGACLQAKSLGRNQVCEASSEPLAERRKNQGNWSGRLQQSVSNGNLLIEALPLRPLQAWQSSTPLAELTAHLNEPGQPAVPLAALIDTAERYDIASTLDNYFLHTAIKSLARAKAHRLSMHCLLPLSKIAISNPDSGNLITQELAEFGISGDGLLLMFPEELCSQQTSQMIEFAARMRAQGCQIVLSEFGGGTASFSLLRTLSPSHVVLSNSLTRNVGDGNSSTALLRAVLEITGEQNILSIAHGIDEISQLEQLRQLGVAYANGKAVAPCEPFEAWFEGAVMRGRIS